MITKAIAQSLKHGDILEHKFLLNADKTPKRCRINGKCQVWKTKPEEFRLPVKHGLYDCFQITQANADNWEVRETFRLFPDKETRE